MRDCSRALFRYIASDSLDPIILLQLQFVGQDYLQSLRVTDAGMKVDVFDTQAGEIVEFAPFPLSRGEITERLASTGGEVPEVTMTVTNVDSQMAALLGAADVSLATATLWLTDRRLIPKLATHPSDLLRLTIGEVRNGVLADQKFTFMIVNVLGQQNRITVPKRVYKAGCNYVFGSAACGFDMVAGNDSNGIPARTSTTAQTGSTAQFIVIPSTVLTTFGSPTDATKFLGGGYVQFTDGAIGLQSRPIQRVDTVGSEIRLYLRSPFLKAPNVGDPCVIQRVCRRVKTDCLLYQGNVLNYGGFEEAPPARMKPTVVQVSS